MSTMVDDAVFSPQQVRAFQELLLGGRRRRGMTQIEVSRAVGVSQTLISQLERGPHKGMRVDELFRLLSFYGISPNQIAEALGYLPPSPSESITDDPRVAALLAQLDQVSDDDYNTILTALEWMLIGSSR